MRLAALLPLFILSAAALAQTEPMLGFSKTSSDAQRALEDKFDSYVNHENPRQWLKRLSAKPHQVGSAYGLENAQFAEGLFKSFGFDVRIERFQVLFPTPKERVLELLGPHPYKAKIFEPEIKQD